MINNGGCFCNICWHWVEQQCWRNNWDAHWIQAENVPWKVSILSIKMVIGEVTSTIPPPCSRLDALQPSDTWLNGLSKLGTQSNNNIQKSVRFKRLYPTSILKTWPKLPRKFEFYAETMASHSLHLTQICRLINTRKLLTSKYFTFKHGYLVHFVLVTRTPFTTAFMLCVVHWSWHEKSSFVWLLLGCFPMNDFISLFYGIFKLVGLP